MSELTMNELTIRPASRFDAPTILRFIKELAEYEKAPQEVTATVADLEASLFGQRPYAEAVIAEVAGKPIGFALYFHNFSTWKGKPGLYLEDLYVVPEMRGSGYGKQLLLHLADIATQRGCPRFEWWCLDWNKPALDFYGSIGAAPMDEWTVQRMDKAAIETFLESKVVSELH
jgi:GNAT superfamily N-acetyltransferase